MGSIATELAKFLGRPPDDPDACLAASLALATRTVAFILAHATFRRNGDVGVAKTTFLAIVDREGKGLAATLAGTSHV